MNSPLHRSRAVQISLAALCVGICLQRAADAAPTQRTYPGIMPLAKVKPGMVGYGLTTFKGNTVSRFHISVIGIIRNANNGRDLILIRMKGGPITERGANLIHGMSGSPIYINNRLIGAFSQGEPFPKEPIGMVTPIEDMLEAWDPNIPQQPNFYQPAEKPNPKTGKPGSGSAFQWRSELQPQTIELPKPIRVGSRTIAHLVINARTNDLRRSTDSTAVLQRATSLLTVGSISERNRVWFQQELDRRGFAVTVVAGAGSSSAGSRFPSAPIRPGSCFGTFLSTGDSSPIGGFGTATYRLGNRILGFGHPLMQLGPLEAAITSAYVVDVFSGVQTSHFIAIPGPIIGSLHQDRSFSVAGEIGRMPRMIPFDVTVNDATNHRSRTFHNRLFQNPDLTPALLTLLLRESVGQIHDIPGDVMARVTTSIDAAEVGKVSRTNLFFDSTDIASTVGQDMSEIMGVVAGNPFYPLPIRSAHVTVDIAPGHNTATLERLFLKQGRYEPGDTMEIGVVIKPYRQEPIVTTIPLKIPADTPSGRYQLIVRGGVVPQFRLGGFSLGGAQDAAQSPPVNVRQMVARLAKHETNTDVLARLVLNSVAPALEGEKLSQLPPNLAALMRSDRNSGVRLEREELRTVQPVGYVTSGVQQLIVTIVRRNSQEQGSPGAPIGPSQPSLPGTPTLALSGVNSGLIARSGDDYDDANTAAVQSDALGALQRPAGLAAWLNALPTREQPRTAQPPVTPPAAPQAQESAKPAPQTAPPAPTSTTGAAQPARPDISNDRPVGRQLQVWRQSARSDLSAGKFTGLSVSNTGQLQIAPTLTRLASTTETYVWSLATDDKGAIYAGTGTTGKVMKIGADARAETLATLPIVSVQSLLWSNKDQALYAGSGVKGSLFKVAPDGSYRLLAVLPDKYILALVQNSNGDLFIGAGGGAIYRIPAEKLTGVVTAAKPADSPLLDHVDRFVKTAADNILALAIDSDGALYAGTGNDGIVYRVTPDGKSSVLFDAKENSITGLAVGPDHSVYAVTGPRAILYRITPDGRATVLFDRTPSFYTSLRTASDGSLYASTVNAIYHFVWNGPDPTVPAVVPLEIPKDVDFLSLAVLPDGGVVAGTGNIGEIYGAGPRWNRPDATGLQTGQYLSVVHDTRLQSRWGSAHWEITPAAGASARLEIRTGNVAEPDSTWTDWSTAIFPGRTEGAIPGPPARFIQYRITIQSPAGARAGVREVSIDYLPRNQAPRVSFQSPAGGERWSRTQTIRWSASDPDNDTLSYELFYSDDAGNTWKPLPAQGKAASPATGASAVPSGPTLDEYTKQVNERNLPEPLKQALIDAFRRRVAGSSNAATRDTNRSLDTGMLPDGTYLFKVIASDGISNPNDAQSALAVSEPFMIVNAVPKISFNVLPLAGVERSVVVQGIATQSLVAVTAMQVRIDGGEWMAASSEDGLFDSQRERFTYTAKALSPGKHSIEVEAFNAAGGRSTERKEVDIK